MVMTAIPKLVLASGLGAGTSTLLDGINERAGHCGYFVTPNGATRSITHICWVTGVVTTGDSILCQLEGIGAADGLPSGIIAVDASGTQVVADINDYAYFETPLTVAYTLTSGLWAACTFKMTTASKSLNVMKSAKLIATGANGGWIVEDISATPGTWVKGTYRPNVALKCSTGEYLIPAGGAIFEKYTFIGINTGTTPRYVGNKILCNKALRLAGVFLPYLEMDYDITLKLVDASGTVLKGDDTTTDMLIAIDADYRSGIAIYSNSEILFPCPKTLAANTAYYLIFSPDTVSSVNIYHWQYETEALKKQDLGIPTGWTINRVTSPTVISFTETATEIAFILPIFDQIDFPAGGGGGQPVLRGSIVR